MIDGIQKVLGKLPVLRSRKNPTVACIVGLVAGGIGLAIYFVSFVDLIIPVGIAIVAGLTLGNAGILGGAIIASLYGYFRVLDSNQRLEAAESHPPAGAVPAGT